MDKVNEMWADFNAVPEFADFSRNLQREFIEGLVDFVVWGAVIGLLAYVVYKVVKNR